MKFVLTQMTSGMALLNTKQCVSIVFSKIVYGKTERLKEGKIFELNSSSKHYKDFSFNLALTVSKKTI